MWSDCFNRLVELAPTSIDYLARRPAMRKPAGPDDLDAMLHASLMRVLANPATAPRLSVNCFETTLDVLHFDIKVRGRRPGTVCMPAAKRPRAWHALYPLEFDHRVAGQIDVEGDRRAMMRWWRMHAGQKTMLATNRRFRPSPDRLWRLLARRYADRWGYLPGREIALCADNVSEPALLRGVTHDYNLVRAVCVLLGSTSAPEAQERLIETVASGSAVVAHNARFALSFSPDARIRRLIERYNQPGPLREEEDERGAAENTRIKL